jgi:hypothetical protein
MFPIDGSQLAVSGYVRSSMTALSVGAHFQDAAGQEIGTADMSFGNPGGWRFYNIQSLLGGQALAVPAGTASGLVCVAGTAPAGTSPANPAYLDLDALAVQSFWPR